MISDKKVEDVVQEIETDLLTLFQRMGLEKERNVD